MINDKQFGILSLLIIFFLVGCSDVSKPQTDKESFLKWEAFAPYIHEFNENDDELYKQTIPNTAADSFLQRNIPYFQCPDKGFEKTYYFRWWTFRKHIKLTPEGYVITEFLPKVNWSGKYNTINCPAGHHFYEGRWLHNSKILEDYAKFWFEGGGSLRRYSFWAPNSILAYSYVHKDQDLVKYLLPHFVENYLEWEKIRLSEDGLFWQTDNLDGMEVSIGGTGKRATINSYMHGDAKAIAEIAGLVGNSEIEETHSQKASQLKELIISKLWDENASFFKTLPKNSDNLVDVRELHGYTPWYFNIPEREHAKAWKFLLSKDGFKAPYGPTSAEQNHKGFTISYSGHECQWNGPSWPFATSMTLKAMANLIRNVDQDYITKKDFLEHLETYANCHRRVREDGKKVFWIDENINPYTGEWISRTRLKTWENGSWSPRKGGVERGKDYNHSSFCDHIISDLMGIQPSFENSLLIDPLIPEDKWDWFCLDRVKVHGKMVTIVWDKTGKKYKKGKGFSIWIEEELKYQKEHIKTIKLDLNN